MEGERLAPDLRLALARIEPSYSPYARCWGWPCKVWLRSGEVAERVLFCQLTKDLVEYRRAFGFPISSDIVVGDIFNIAESPHRLPARFANELYLGGETGMGYLTFTAMFYSGMWRHYGTNSSVDFVDYPLLMSPSWVHSVRAHHRQEHHHKCPAFRVCYFKE